MPAVDVVGTATGEPGGGFRHLLDRTLQYGDSLLRVPTSDRRSGASIRRRPSPALIVAIVALVVACAGTATAAGVLISSSNQIERGAINSGDLANRRGVSLADLTPRTRFRLQGDRGSVGPEGPPGPQGPAGPRGQQGDPGSSLGFISRTYAHVRPDGTFDQDGNGPPVESVAIPPSLPGRGVYCFDMSGSPVAAQTSIDFTSTSSRSETIYPILPKDAAGSEFIATRCPAAQQKAAAFVSNPDGATEAEKNPQRGFWITFEHGFG